MDVGPRGHAVRQGLAIFDLCSAYPDGHMLPQLPTLVRDVEGEPGPRLVQLPDERGHVPCLHLEHIRQVEEPP